MGVADHTTPCDSALRLLCPSILLSSVPHLSFAGDRWNDRRGHRSDVARAAAFIYLNKTCYNGLYRVNSKGQFNVPMGRYENPRIRDEGTLRAASAALQGVCLEVRDFRTLVDLGQPGDFFYFDPPYDPLTKTAHFTGYTAGGFGDQDQCDLAGVFARLTDKGCRCMLSNSYTPFVLELYRRFRIETVWASRPISSDSRGRGRIREVAVLNYQPKEEGRPVG